MEKEIHELSREVEKYHRSEKEMLYFGLGSREGMLKCKLFLLELHKKARIDNESFLIYSRHSYDCYCFSIIRQHFSAISMYYSTKKSDLELLFLRSLISFELYPLNHDILSSMSFFSSKVYLQPKKLMPDPVPAFVDGYYRFIIDIYHNKVCIPLADREESESSMIIPPSIWFRGPNWSKETALLDFVFNQSSLTARRTQFEAFISVITSKNKTAGYLTSFEEALLSKDLCFSLSLTLLASDRMAFPAIFSMLELFNSKNMLQFFVFSLVCSCTESLSNDNDESCLELVALTNIWIALSTDWAQKITPNGGIAGIIGQLVSLIKNGSIPELALCFMSSMFTLLSNDINKCISILMEVIIHPFASSLSLLSEFDKSKSLMHKSKEFSHDIKTILKMLIGKRYELPSQNRIKNIKIVHDTILSYLDSFVRSVIIINTRDYMDHPVFKLLVFLFKNQL